MRKAIVPSTDHKKYESVKLQSRASLFLSDGLTLYCGVWTDAATKAKGRVIFHVKTRKYVFRQDRKIRLLAVVGQTLEQVGAPKVPAKGRKVPDKGRKLRIVRRCNRFLAKKMRSVDSDNENIHF